MLMQRSHQRKAFSVRLAEDGLTSVARASATVVSLGAAGSKMPHMNGLELLQRISEGRLPVVTIIMTAFGTVETV